MLVERARQHSERQRDEDELPGDGGTHRRHPAAVAVARSGQAEEGLRRGQQQREDQRKETEFNDHAWLLQDRLRSARGDQVLPGAGAGAAQVRRTLICRVHVRLQAVRHLGRHVVLVVLGEDFLGHEAIAVELAARDDALPLAEQVRQDAGVADRNFLLEVGQYEGDLEAARLAL